MGIRGRVPWVFGGKVRLGWKNTRPGRAKSTANKQVSFTAEQEAKLTSVNALDMEFYEHAKTVAKGLTEACTKNSEQIVPN